MAGPTKLKIGSQLDRFPGRSFNLLIDGYNRQRAGLPRSTPGGARGGQTLSVTAVNETGEVLEYGHCVAIEGLYVAVESVAVQVYNRPVLKAKIPSDSLDHTVIGVSTGTVAAGGVGTFTIMGATWIRWKKTNAAHKFAKLDTAMVSYDPAAISSSGGYPVLDSETPGALPDTVWAVALLGGAGGTTTKWSMIKATADIPGRDSGADPPDDMFAFSSGYEAYFGPEVTGEIANPSTVLIGSGAIMFVVEIEDSGETQWTIVQAFC